MLVVERQNGCANCRISYRIPNASYGLVDGKVASCYRACRISSSLRVIDGPVQIRGLFLDALSCPQGNIDVNQIESEGEIPDTYRQYRDKTNGECEFSGTITYEEVQNRFKRINSFLPKR